MTGRKKNQALDGSAEPDGESRPPGAGRRLAAAVGKFLLETAIPLSLSLGAFYYVAERVRLWKAGPFPLAAVFVLLVVGGSLALGAGLAYLLTLWGWLRSRRSRERLKPRRYRRLRLVASHFLVPLLISCLVALLPLSGETLLTRLVRSIQLRGEYKFIPRITETVIRARETGTKTQGVETLSAIHTRLCLDEMFRVLDEEIATLEEWSFYVSMREALASYESLAKPGLLDVFRTHDGKVSLSTAAPTETGLHQRLFKPQIDRLREEAADATTDPGRREQLILMLDEIELQLKQGLQDVEVMAPEIGGSQTVLGFVLAVFLSMEGLEADSEVYELALRVAPNRSYDARTRAKAILLIAKLGGRKDFPVILPYLEADSELIQAAALTAIRNLHNKISGSREEDT